MTFSAEETSIDMFCPQCGSTQPDELNFCKACGANLGSVRTALVSAPQEGKFDWNKTWLAEMLMTHDEIDRRKGKTPEVKRQNEIKAGVITASAGTGLTIALYAVMQGIIASGMVSDAAIAILSRVWAVGVIPIFVGLALIVTGTLITKKNSSPSEGIADDDERQPAPSAARQLTDPVPFSVTDETTRHLDPVAKGNKTADL